MTLLHKAAAPVLEIKELTDAGRISGYASIFGNIDLGGDRVMPGAYTKTIASGRRVRMLWQHDPHEVIGGWDVLREDEKGLWVEGGFNMEVQRGREAYHLMKAEQIDGLSIGYSIPAGGAKKAADGARELHELGLHEVSVVTMPMNEEATAQAKANERMEELIAKVAAGDRLTEREFEELTKGTWGLSNSQAERAARLHLKGQGEPVAAADDAAQFWAAMRG